LVGELGARSHWRMKRVRHEDNCRPGWLDGEEFVPGKLFGPLLNENSDSE